RATASATVQFLIVFQASDDAAPPAFDTFDVDLVTTSIMSVSHARNIGIIRARESGYDGIIFHDASVWYSPGYLGMVDMALNSPSGSVVMGEIAWSNAQEISAHSHYRSVSPDVLTHCHVWAYIFPVSSIAGFLFDERLGPGRYTSPKCGEDVIFMQQYFSRNHVRKIFIGGSQVCHPPRPKDLSKQLLYAEGQGAIYRYLLRNGYYGRL